MGIFLGQLRFKAMQSRRPLYRTVLACISWKLSRWPFRKSIAEELDRVHCQMLAFVLPCARLVTETIDQYCRRRCTNARNVAMHAGMWSDIWCKRIINWNYHLERACNYNHMCSRLLKYHDAVWLQSQRAKWVSENDSRNSIVAGRTGTRACGCRPQVRWSDGIQTAVALREASSRTVKGNNAKTIGSRIQEAVKSLRFLNTHLLSTS